MKTILVVARNVREFDDYVRVVRDMEQGVTKRVYRYVHSLNDLAGRRPNQTECILLGRYFERRDWLEMQDHLKARGIDCIDQYHWR